MWSWLWWIASQSSPCFSRSVSPYLFAMKRLSIEWSSKSRTTRELWKGSRRACPVPACQLRNRDLTVVMCSVSTIVRRTKRGIQSGCDDGLHDGRTGGQYDAPAARRSYLPQSVPLSRVLRTSLIKVRVHYINSLYYDYHFDQFHIRYFTYKIQFLFLN